MSRKLALETGDLLALLSKAATERFKEDPCAPGILVSHVERERATATDDCSDRPTDVPLWYVAVHRYTGSYGSGRHIVDKVYSEDLDDAIHILATRLAEGIPVIRAQLALAKAVRQ